MSSLFIEQLLQHKKIGVVSHIRPDGDAIGSQIAACIWLSKFGKQVYAFNDDSIPENLGWMLPYFPIQKSNKELVESCDAYLCLDGNAAKRFGQFGETIFNSGKPVYLIDHHPFPEGNFAQQLHNTKACSTAELVFHLFMNTNMDLLTTEAAKALYCGLVTDTGSFRFDSVNADVHTIVSEILRRGNFNPSEVHEAIFDNRNVNQIQLLGAALNSLKTAADGKIGIIRIHDSDFKHTQTEYSDSDGFSAYALGLKGVIASVVFSELEQGIKLSLRSKRGIDCTKWASFFDGGGHARASGGWFYGTMDEAEKQVIAKGMELLESA